MDYTKYTVEDFVLDEGFKKWVKNVDPEINIFWEEWLKQHPEKAETVEKARYIIGFYASDMDDHSNEDLLEVWERIENTIQTSDLSRQTSTSTFINQWYKVAAAFAGLMLLSGFVYFIAFYNHQNYSTTFGETKEIYLPDSTKVTLNANSTLTVKGPWFFQQEREVWLEGEAFFEVEKKVSKQFSSLGSKSPSSFTGRKFVVHSNNVLVEVLGTKFNVNNRRGLVKVILNSGKVKIESPDQSLFIQPGEMASFSQSHPSYSIENVDAERLTSWRFRKIVFEKTSLKEIARVIEDNYGYRVEYANEDLANKNFTGVIPYQNLDLFLTVLAETFNIQITKQKKLIKMEDKR